MHVDQDMLNIEYNRKTCYHYDKAERIVSKFIHLIFIFHYMWNQVDKTCKQSLSLINRTRAYL